jgi:mercuric reductase
MNTQQAVDKLNSQLPLKARQDQLSPACKAAHQAILRTLVQQGRPPSDAELQMVIGNESLSDCLQRLGADDLVVLDATGSHPVGAYPVTLEITPHTVEVNGHTIHAMCALDAVSVAAMFDTTVDIMSRCHSSDTPITIRMQGSDILAVTPTTGVMIGIRWQMPSAVAAHSMCMEMVFLKDRPTADAWQNLDTDNTTLFTLPEAVAFGQAFFLPLMS